MTRVANAQVVDLPPPYNGIMDRLPLAAIQHPFCEKMTNYDCQDGDVMIRNGDDAYITPLASGSYGLGLVSTGAGKLYLVARLDGSTTTSFYDVSNFAVPNPSSVHDVTIAVTFTPVLGASFAGSTFFFSKGGALNFTNGTKVDSGGTWTNTPYTFVGSLAASFHAIASSSYKNRLYMVSSATAGINLLCMIAYSDVDATGGNATVADFTGIFSTNGFLVAVRAVSVADTISAETFFIMLSSSGEIVAYSGAYPESADWQLVGRFFVPEPRGWDCIIDYQGDALIITSGGLISVRDLFLKGNNIAVTKGLSSPINRMWRNLMNQIPPNGDSTTFDVDLEVNGTWDSFNSQIIVKFPIAIDYNGTPLTPNRPTFLVYDINTASWVYHLAAPAGSTARSAHSIAFYKNQVVYITSRASSVWKKEGKTNYLDDVVASGTTISEAAYTAQITSAPLPISKSAQKILTGLELITTTDMNAGIKTKLIGNFGQQTTGNVILPAQGVFPRANTVSVGINSTYVQYDISYDGSVTGSTIGCEILAASPIYSQGGIG